MVWGFRRALANVGFFGFLWTTKARQDVHEHGPRQASFAGPREIIFLLVLEFIARSILVRASTAAPALRFAETLPKALASALRGTSVADSGH